MSRISARVREASDSMTRRASIAASGRASAVTRPACAWITIAETWWATVSCSSRASCSRSRIFTWSSSRARELDWYRTARPRSAGASRNGMPIEQVADVQVHERADDVQAERDGQADDDVAPGAPTAQRVRQQEHERHRVEAEGVVAGHGGERRRRPSAIRTRRR